MLHSRQKKTNLASAPSNIALVKYMGKEDRSLNLPSNGSLSLTLSELCTQVEVESEASNLKQIQLIPEPPQGQGRQQGSRQGNRPPIVPNLSESGVSRVTKHVERVREAIPSLFLPYGLEWDTDRSLTIRTANTFPAASGIASSASSFAAMTMAFCSAFSVNSSIFMAVFQREASFKCALARLSRLGSGSSCRSFEGPWVQWEGQEVSQVKSSLPPMTDLVLLISSQSKEVSSSQAHEAVKSSPLWIGRVDRANDRLVNLKSALVDGDLKRVSQIAWDEMWEMHSLFHTAHDPFTYWEPETVRVLKWVKSLRALPNPPIVTLDAGPNVHLLVETGAAEEWKEKLKAQFPHLPILEDRQGLGATCVEIS